MAEKPTTITMERLRSNVWEAIQDDWFHHDPDDDHGELIATAVDSVTPVMHHEMIELLRSSPDIGAALDDPGVLPELNELDVWTLLDASVRESLMGTAHECVEHVKRDRWAIVVDAYWDNHGRLIPKGALICPDAAKEAYDLAPTPNAVLALCDPEKTDRCHFEALDYLDSDEADDVAEGRRMVDAGETIRREPENRRLDYNEAQAVIDQAWDAEKGDGGGLPDDVLDRILEHSWRFNPLDADLLASRYQEQSEAEVDEVLFGGAYEIWDDHSQMTFTERSDSAENALWAYIRRAVTMPHSYGLTADAIPAEPVRFGCQARPHGSDEWAQLGEITFAPADVRAFWARVERGQ